MKQLWNVIFVLLTIAFLTGILCSCDNNININKEEFEIKVINTSIGNSINKIIINNKNYLLENINSLDTGKFYIEKGTYDLKVIIDNIEYIESNLEIKDNKLIYLPN